VTARPSHRHSHCDGTEQQLTSRNTTCDGCDTKPRCRHNPRLSPATGPPKTAQPTPSQPSQPDNKTTTNRSADHAPPADPDSITDSGSTIDPERSAHRTRPSTARPQGQTAPKFARAVDDPATLAKGARIVRAALARRLARVSKLGAGVMSDDEQAGVSLIK
jgi:hypothetical protein